MTVVHNEAAQRFEGKVEGATAVCDYRRSGDSIVFYHTEVPPEYEGRGYGARLVREALNYARSEGLKVVPQCWFVAEYIRRHPDEATVA